jgi:hypothetical protein
MINDDSRYQVSPLFAKSFKRVEGHWVTAFVMAHQEGIGNGKP